MLFGKKLIEKKIFIEGLKCGGCVKRVENVLSSFKEIKTLNVSLDEKCAYLALKKDIDNNILSQAIEDLGFKVINIE
ncbi:MAG: heavy-metal-associated domain-containing protein [Bacilli bacterium]|nr:heavy-metal-associated domain-containing protein [Bacilli bacterium]